MLAVDNKKTCCECLIEKSIVDFHRDKSCPDSLCRKCKTCNNNHHKRYYAKNKNIISKKSKEYRTKNKIQLAEKSKEYYQNNKEDITKSVKKYRDDHKDEIKESKKEHYAENREAYLEYKRRYYAENKVHLSEKCKEWALNNKSVILANVKKYKMKKKNQMPEYADEIKIKIKYKIAKILSSFGKTKYHVDHIIPLQGVLITGFHHEDNLQIMRSGENIRKSNKFIPFVIYYSNGKEVSREKVYR